MGLIYYGRITHGSAISSPEFSGSSVSGGSPGTEEPENSRLEIDGSVAGKLCLVAFVLNLMRCSFLSILRRPPQFRSSSAAALEEALFSQEILNAGLFGIRVR